MIIAIKEKDRAVVCYTNLDSWRGLSEEDYIDEENVAIKFSSKGTLFGFSNLNHSSDILLYDDVFLEKEIAPKNIVKEMIPYIKEKLEKSNCPVDDEGTWENALLLCDNEHIYGIDPKFGFYEAEDYACHGYGDEVLTIIGVLDLTVGKSAETRILEAIDFVDAFYKENLYPIVIVDTKRKKKKYFYQGGTAHEHIDSL